MASSAKVVVPIFLLVSILCTVSVIYGALEMSDGERSALEVLQDLISGKLSLKDIWNALTGEDAKAEGTCAGPDTNGVYEFDVDGNCVKLSCKPGYFEQGGICIQQRDLSDDVYTGEVDVDCEISGYQLSECRNALSGDVLTGDIGSCGVGQQTKTPITSSVQIGLTGTCEQPTTVDCEVPCPLECEAPESLWAPTGDAKCRAIHNGTPVVLGDIDPVTGFGYCGQGTRINTLSEGNITGSDRGGMNLEDYKSSINWSLCETEKLGNCPLIPCTGELIDIGCPTPEDSWDWIFANQGAVYTTESAEKVIGREIAMGGATLMGGVTRTQAIELGVLNTEGTEVIDETKMPMGRRIRFKAGEQNSYEYLTEKKCSIVELVPTYAPRISADCVYEYGYGDCAEIGCGQMYKKWQRPVTTKMAWGNGTCNPPQAIQVDCSTQSASCCDERFVGAWTEVEGYQGCVADNGTMKRKYTRTGNGTSCSNSNVKYENDDNCKYIDGVAKVVLTSSFSRGDDDTHFDPHMLFKYIDSSGTTHETSKIQNNATKTFDPPVKLTYMKGGLFYKGSEYNFYGAATKASVLDVNVYDRDNNLLKNFHKEYPLGYGTSNLGGYYATDKPGSEDWFPWYYGGV